ncbi:MAG: ABC transporter substrate-binding protein [Nitrospinota bacterium]
MPPTKKTSVISLIGAVTALFLVLGLWGVGPRAAVAAEKVTFILDWIPYGSHTGFFTSLNKGIFRDTGLDVTIRRGYGSGDTVKLITAGKGDFGFADTGTLVVGRSRGAKAKTVGVLYNKAPHTAFALKRSGIRTVKDLGGRSIGEAQGGAAIAVFPALAKIHGVKKWKFVPMSPASKNPALLAGKVDAILTFADVGPSLRRGAKKTGNEIVELRYGDNGLDFYGNGIIVRDEDINSRPKLIRLFVNAAFRGAAHAIKNPDEGVKFLIQSNPNLNAAMARAQWDVLTSLAWTDETRKHGLGYMSETKMRQTVDLISKYRELKGKPPLSEVYAPQFLEKIFP